jgi:hypothetical protein
MSTYIGNVGLSNKTDGLYLGLVNISLNTSPNQILFSPSGYDISGLNLGDGLDISGSDLKTVGNPAIQLTAHSFFANENQVSIQSQIDLANQADVVNISAGSYSEDVEINDKTNIAVIAPAVGNTICEVDGLQITGDSQLIRVCNLQVQGATNIIAGRGRYHFKNVEWQGTSTTANNISIDNFDYLNYATFENCEFDQYCVITVPITFAGVIYFINCNFGGATLVLEQSSVFQVIINNCAGLKSFPTTCTLIGMNALVNTGESRITATNLDSKYLLINGASTNTSVNQNLTTNGALGLKLTPTGGFSSYWNVFFDNGVQTVKSEDSTTPIILYEKLNVQNIIPELRMLVKCIFNFRITNASPDIIFRLVMIDGATENTVQSFTQSFSRSGHHSFPINFNYIMPYSLAFKITARVSAGDIETDVTDYYSVIVDEVQATE